MGRLLTRQLVLGPFVPSDELLSNDLPFFGITEPALTTSELAPHITSLSLDTAYLSGRQFLTITGTKFTGVTSVLFGDQPPEWWSFVDDNTINCLMFCVDHAQTVALSVTTASGSGSAPFGFLYSQITGAFTLQTTVAVPNMDGNGQNPLGPDLKLWLTTNPGRIVNVDDSLTPNYFDLNAASNTASGAQCCGPDGNIWSVDPPRKSIWKTPPGGGASTEYTLTAGTYTYWSVVVDPNGSGDLWVVASDVATRLDLYLFKVTTAGTVTPYGPFTGKAMLGACIGPDLRLWGIKDGSNVYAADLSTSTPTVTGYNMTAITHDVYNLCVGNDLRMWASDNSGNYYAFDVSDPTTGTPYDTVLSVSPGLQACAGPDGQVWNLDGQTSTAAVVLFSTALDGTQVALPSVNLATGDVYAYLLLTAGADGALYSPGAGATAGSWVKFTGGAVPPSGLDLIVTHGYGPLPPGGSPVYLTDEDGNLITDEDGNLIQIGGGSSMKIVTKGYGPI